MVVVELAPLQVVLPPLVLPPLVLPPLLTRPQTLSRYVYLVSHQAFVECVLVLF